MVIIHPTPHIFSVSMKEKETYVRSYRGGAQISIGWGKILALAVDYNVRGGGPVAEPPENF